MLKFGLYSKRNLEGILEKVWTFSRPEGEKLGGCRGWKPPQIQLNPEEGARRSDEKK